MSEAQWQRQLSEDVGEMKADLRAVRQRIDGLPCAAHSGRLTQLERNGTYQRGMGRGLVAALALGAALLGSSIGPYLRTALAALVGR